MNWPAILATPQVPAVFLLGRCFNKALVRAGALHVLLGTPITGGFPMLPAPDVTVPRGGGFGGGMDREIRKGNSDQADVAARRVAKPASS